MLYKLEVENFFSVRDRQVLDLTIDAKVPDLDTRFAPIFEGSTARVPKVVVLYGANASGKTTVLRALEFIVTMIRDSVQRTIPGFAGCERFNDAESANRPIKLAIEIGGIMNATPEVLQRAQAGEKVEQGVYRYELQIDVVNGFCTRILHEVLQQRPNDQGKWQRVFDRDADGKVKGSKSFSLSGFQHLVKTLAANHTVLSSFAKFQHPTARIFVDIARKGFFSIEPVAHTNADKAVIDYLKNQPTIVSRLNAEMNRIDVGVEGMRFIDGKDGPYLMFKHAGLEQEMPWLLESHGTRAFIKVFPFLMAALDQGGVVAIDEMDAAIHPLVLPELLRWFYNRQTRNPYDAQLWLSCHSASLLDDLQKEEIVICEKDRQGRTQFFSLMDVKVRRDENHYRKYLSGAYGGVPLLG
jgi:energy-coupling factor transporter ATP-binding protein EcfA2